MRKIIKQVLCVSLSLIAPLFFSNDSITGNHSMIINSPAAKDKKEYTKSIIPVDYKDLKPLRKQSELQTKLYEYLNDLNNRESVKNTAIKLNNGHQHNSCVYFASEALRRLGYKVPSKICYTGNSQNILRKDISIIHYLQKMGWHQSKNLSELLPGDICFTTPNSEGHFTHAYIFMGWVEQKKFDYAYVCDNQSYDYGTTLHIRNIKNISRDKDPFYFYMYLEK